MQEERFTFKYYTKLVDTMLLNGYSIANYDNYENFEKVLFSGMMLIMISKKQKILQFLNQKYAIICLPLISYY